MAYDRVIIYGEKLSHQLFSRGRGRRDSFLGIFLDFDVEIFVEVHCTRATVLHSPNLLTMLLPYIDQGGKTDNGSLSLRTPPEFYHVVIDKRRTHG